MDDLNLSGEELRRNLQELEVINNLLGGHKVVLDALDHLTQQFPGKTFRIADIGCGGGDTLKSIAKWAYRKGVAVHLTGIDANDFMVQYARQQCNHLQHVAIEKHDVFSPEFARKQYDIVICSLFCHHFSDEQLIRMFRQLQQQAKAVIINDLHRHWLAYYSIKYITAVFSGSRLVKNDAPLSVWRAFKKEELEQLVKQACIQTYTLRWMWAFRWQLILYRASENN